MTASTASIEAAARQQPYMEPCALWKSIEDRNDAKAASLARKDLAKLLEINSVSGMAPVVLAATYGLYETVSVALERGVHPDDPSVFTTPLLGLFEWHSNHKLVALAIKNGANPNAFVSDSLMAAERALVARHLALRLFINGDFFVDESNSQASAESMALILTAGATTADVDAWGELVSSGRPSIAWLIASTATRRPEHENRLAALIPLLKAAGADIDTPCGSQAHNVAAPIIAAVRKKSRLMVESFIAAGARVDDAHLVRVGEPGTPSSYTLFNEVDQYFDAGESSWVRESVMRKVLADAKGGAGNPIVSPETTAARRRHKMPGV